MQVGQSPKYPKNGPEAVGGALTVIVVLALALAPRLSYAVAITVCVPAPILFHAAE